MVNVRHVTGLAAALLVAGCATSEPTEPFYTSSAAPATTTAGAAPSSSKARSIPKAIPASAFLQVSDAPEKARQKPARADHDLPAFCGKSYEQKDRIGVRATQLLLIQSKGESEGSTPKSAVYEDVLVYRGDGAKEFMTDLRAAVKNCASDEDDKNFLRGSIEAGDDSELIEQSTPATDDAGEPVQGQPSRLFWAVVRHADTIAFVSNTGWESSGAEKADTVKLGTRAAARVKEWRG
ncbi:hypothetical protein Afe05nite_28160 [Paractinoplanes ferrugineus]|uniref:PknH-like extracellular domain-containing protein n=1 Tax=Paractinoplanes ferrugineus TaxID=113564 RepID=A0A919IXP1_9ACTN|nr:hypothetical protein Afe05nite_28160 [Actinoplanes ferrugineus]